MNTAGQVTDGGTVKLRKCNLSLRGKYEAGLEYRDSFQAGRSVWNGYSLSYLLGTINIKRKILRSWKHRYTSYNPNWRGVSE